jgi:threonine/homoserine/homoserine lactone efflux protein
MTVNNIIAVCIFLAPFSYSPGPGVMFFAVNSARSGFKKILPAITGYHLGIFIFTFCFGLGFDFFVSRYGFILDILKYFGSIYVLYIAYKITKTGFNSDSKNDSGITFFNGMIFIFLNPKAHIVITLMYTNFNDSGNMNTLIYTLILTIVFSVNNLISTILYSLSGNIIGNIGDNKISKFRNAFFGFSLALVAVWMLIN